MKSGVKILCMLAAGFIFIAALVFIPKCTAAGVPAIDYKDPLVTPSEYAQLEVPMPAKKAREILDGPGQRVPGHPHKRVYQLAGHPNAEVAKMIVWYNKGRLVYGAYLVITVH